MFSCEFCEISKTPFFTENFPAAASVHEKSGLKETLIFCFCVTNKSHAPLELTLHFPEYTVTQKILITDTFHELIDVILSKKPLLSLSLRMSLSFLRSSHWRCSIKKCILIKFAKLTGHNPTCVSTLAIATGSLWATVVISPSPCRVQEAVPLEALAILLIPGFQIAFPCIIR